MKHLSRLSSTLVLACACSLLPTAAIAQQIQVNKDNRTLAVTASDTASAMADTATVHIGFLSYGPDAKAAYATGTATSNRIAKSLTAAGAAKAALESESQSLTETPQFELEKLPPAEQSQKKFQLRQSWIVKTKAAEAARILNTAINAGANQSGQIDWSVADEDSLEAKAAGKALARAHAVAAQMARGLNITLGNLIYASNQGPEPRPIIMRGMLANVASGSGPIAESAPLAISPRKVERSATVYAVFSIQ